MAVAPDNLVVGADDFRTQLRNRVSWGAILAGVATALVVQVLLNILGLGVGASSLDAANLSDNPSASGFSLSAGIWYGVSVILASLAGGVVAGRLSGTSHDNTARWHGMVAWAVTTLLVIYLLTSAVGSIVGGTFNALGSTISAVGKGAASTVSGVSGTGAGDVLQNEVRRLVNPNDAQNVQDSIVTYIRASIDGDKAKADAARDQAVNGLARTANISPDEARTRLNQAEQQAKQAADQAKQTAQKAAEAARQGTATGGIAVFVTLLLGAIAGWIGGGIGSPRPTARVQNRI